MKIRISLLVLVFILQNHLTHAQEPNIIMIMTDDQGWFDAGFNGNKEIYTPNLDKLAHQGVILDRFYSASAVCSPTRASVVTGRNPYRMGIPGANTGHMKKQEITLAEILKKEGYATGHFGKWHLGTLTTTEKDANRGGKPKFHKDYSIPSMHGYDTFFCTESKVPTYDPMIYPLKFDECENKRYGWKAIENNQGFKNYGTAYWEKEGTKTTKNLKGDDSKVIMDRVLPFVKNSIANKQPFFTTIWMHTPHLPVVASKAQREAYKDLPLRKQIYYGTISGMDAQVGRLWDTLETLGVADNTILWFCSDNGPENKTPGSAKHFRERKRSLYEGGVRVPAFVIWKKGIPQGKRLDFPAVTSDYLPTTLDLLNIKYPDNRPIDGQSLVKLLNGKKKTRKKPIGFLYANKMSWVNQTHKLISTDKGKTFELYNLITDPSEKNNIISKEPKIAAKMKKQFLKWKTSVKNSNDEKDY